MGEIVACIRAREDGPGGRVGQDERYGRYGLLQRLPRLRVVVLSLGGARRGGIAVLVFEDQRKSGERICKYQFDLFYNGCRAESKGL